MVLRNDQCAKWRLSGERAEQTLQAWPSQKLGTADPVIDVHGLVKDVPFLAGGERPGVFDLPRDRLLLVGDV
jgi:hypothetical protein